MHCTITTLTNMLEKKFTCFFISIYEEMRHKRTPFLPKFLNSMRNIKRLRKIHILLNLKDMFRIQQYPHHQFRDVTSCENIYIQQEVENYNNEQCS